MITLNVYVAAAFVGLFVGLLLALCLEMRSRWRIEAITQGLLQDLSEMTTTATRLQADWHKEREDNDHLRAGLTLERSRYDAAIKVLFAQAPVAAIGAIDDIEAGRVPDHVDDACRRGGLL